MAHINLSDAFAKSEFNGFGGIDLMETNSGSGGISDLKNFRVLADKSLKKRDGFAPILELPSGKLRASFVVSPQLLFMLIGSRLYKVDPKDRSYSQVQELEGSEKDACFFYYGNVLHLLDGSELYFYNGESFVATVGYVPLYANCWDTGTVGDVYEPPNCLSKRIRMKYRVASDGLRTIILPFSISSVDGALVNGIAASSLEIRTDSAYDTYVSITKTYAVGSIIELFLTLKEPIAQRTEVTSCTRAETFGVGEGGVEPSSLAFYGGDDESKLFTTRHVDSEEMSRVLKFYPDASTIYFPTGQALNINADTGSITAAARSGSSLMVFAEKSAYILNEKESSKLIPISQTSGCEAKNGVIAFENSPITISRNGIFRWSVSSLYDDEYTAKCISMPINSLLFSTSTSALTAYHKSQNELWFYKLGDERVFIYNTLLDTWYTFDGFAPEQLFELDGEMAFVSNQRIYAFSPSQNADVTPSGARPISASVKSSIIDFGSFNRHKRLARALLKCSPASHFILRIYDSVGNETSVNLADTNGERLGCIERRVGCKRSRYYSFSLSSEVIESDVLIYGITLTAVK